MTGARPARETGWITLWAKRSQCGVSSNTLPSNGGISMQRDSTAQKIDGASIFGLRAKRKRTGFILGLGLLLSLAWGCAVFGGAGWVMNVDNAFFDALTRLTSGKVQPGRVVLVDVDEQSLSAVGQWPWPRYRLAALLKNLAAAAPAALGLDMFFSEPDRTSLSTIRETFRREFDLEIGLTGLPKGLEDNDAYLGHVLSGLPAAGSVILLYNLENLDTPCNLPSLDITGDVDGLDLPEATGLLCNVPPIQAGLKSSGYINTSKDADGVLRRMPLLSKYAGRYYPSLTLATLMLAANTSKLTIESDFFGRRLRLEDISIPLDNQGGALLRFEGPDHSYPYVSALDVLTENFDPALLRGRIIMLGSSASGLNDLHYTALSPGFPGLEAHAVLLNNAFSGNYLREPVWSGQYALLSTLLAGIAASLLFCLPGHTWTWAGLVLTLSLFPGLSYVFFRWFGVLLPTAGPVLSIGSQMTALSLLLYVQESRLAKIRLEKLAVVKQATLESMVAVAETRDMDTGGHIKRTQLYVKVLAEGLRNSGKCPWLSSKYIELLYLSSPLHDVGKVAIPDSILCKPGKLTDEEFTLMKQHVLYGKQIMDAASQCMPGDDFLDLAGEMALTHHEKWDGSGYMQGLAGEAIPLSGRLMAVADVYDALVSTRPYKKGLPHDVAKAILLEGSGSHFDPILIEIFCSEEEQFKAIAARHSEPKS
jgi:adenylate cyclase